MTNNIVLDMASVSRTRYDASSQFCVAVSALRLRQGDILAVTGPSGTGKSTLLEMIGLTLAPDVADGFQLAGHDIHSHWRHDQRDALTVLRGRYIGYLLQHGGLLPYLSAHDNIMLPSQLMQQSVDNELYEKIIYHLSINAVMHRLPSGLSAGERQRVALARALLHKPALLLADEPTASLDPDNADAVFALMVAMVKDYGLTAIIVSHDVARVRAHQLPEISPTVIEHGSMFTYEVI